MNINTEKLLRLSKRMLKRTEEYQENRKSDMSEEDNFQMEYLLVFYDINPFHAQYRMVAVL